MCKKISIGQLSENRNKLSIDYIISHVCSCGHDFCDHDSDILDENNNKCTIEDCSCWRFLA